MMLFEKVTKMAEDSRIFNDLSLPRKRLKLSDNSPSSCLFNSNEIGDFHSKENLTIDSLDLKKFDILSSPPLSPPTSAFQDHSNGFGANLGLTLNCDSDLTNGGDSGFNELTMSDSINGVDLGGTGTNNGNANNDNKIGNEDSESSSDDSDSISEISDLSGFSDLSDSEKSPRSCSDHMCWIQKQMISGMQPRTILEYLVPPGHKILIPNHVDDWTLWEIVYSVINEPPRREKLKHLNVFEDILRLISTCKKIIVLTGAGVSVSCGIPDFRSRDGIYARLAKDFPDLPDPQSMFDIQYFRKDPRPFYKFAKEVFPGSFEPSTCHKFIKLLEERNQLLRNYTQNIDTLEKVAGISNVVECHGSFATASCLNCSYKVDSAAIKEDVFNQKIPYCKKCVVDNKEQAVLKPDIVFFGEGLPETFHSMIEVDKEECDLLIVIGSSLKVRPVALIPNSLPPNVPQILINRETLPQCTFDIELLGDCDVIVNEICHRLGSGFNQLCYNDIRLTETRNLNSKNENISHSSEEATNSTNSRESNLNTSHLSAECREIFNAAKNDGDLKVLNNEIKVGEITESHSKEESNSIKKIAKSGVTSRFPENTYLFCPPSRYIFSGAEICGSELDSDAVEIKENTSLRNLSDLELELQENCLPVTSNVDDIIKSADTKIENTKNVVALEAKSIHECK